MDRMFVVTAIEYRPADEEATSPMRVDDLGFSIVRLTKPSGRDGTDVRADLQIEDDMTRMDLARHYAENTQLEWTFEIGGGGRTFTVVLRWAQFDLLTGALQVVETTVPRALIHEVEARSETDSGTSPNRRSPPDASLSTAPTPERPDLPSMADAREERTDSASFAQKISDLWPRLFYQDGGLKSDE